MSEISVIILTFNSREYIEPCLVSLFNQGQDDVEVIVIDNGSEDNTIDLIKSNYPQAKLIANRENVGASKAKNQGIEASSARWILTLDCDVVLEDGFIKKAKDLINNSKDSIGLIQPMILSRDKKSIYSCGIRYSWLERFHDIGKGRFDTIEFNTTKLIFGACCAAALYRRKTLEDLKDDHGYFDERFFFLFEDADLSWRAQKKGWFCLYYPELKCFHHGNSSSTDKNTRHYLSLLNRQMMILKNQNFIKTLFKSPLYLIYDLPRFLVLAIKFRFKFPKFRIKCA